MRVETYFGEKDHIFLLVLINKMYNKNTLVIALFSGIVRAPFLTHLHYMLILKIILLIDFD